MKVINSDRKSLLKNMLSLSSLQVVNYILPLITLPYQVRVIGIEKYGLLSFAIASVSYFQILIDFGYNLTAPRLISINRENREKVSEIYSCVLLTKFVLFIFSAFILFTLTKIIDRFNQSSSLLFICYISIFTQILYPVWFFLGMEKMKYITILSISSRIVFTVLVFFVVKRPEDFYKIPVLTMVGTGLSSIGALWVIKTKFKIKFICQNVRTLVFYAKNSVFVLVSDFASSLATVSNTFILGLFADNKIVGYFAVADRLIGIAKSFMTPVSQSLYPFISKKMDQDKEKGIKIIRKFVLYIGIFGLIVSLFILFFSPFLVWIIVGKYEYESIRIIGIMSFLPFFVAMSNLFGTQTMLTMGMQRAFMFVIISEGILNLVMSLCLVPYMFHLGSAISVTITEVYTALVMFFYLKKRNMSPNPFIKG